MNLEEEKQRVMQDGMFRRIDPNPTLDKVHIINDFVSQEEISEGNQILSEWTLSQWPGNPSVMVANKLSNKVFNYLKPIAERSANKIKELFDLEEELYPTDIQLGNWSIGGDAGLHTDTQNADWTKYSSIIYINDEFEGGELSFPDLGFDYKPKAGDFISFPADYWHRVWPVTSGTRRTIIDFYAYDYEYADYFLFKKS
jgi:hypothetical protein